MSHDFEEKKDGETVYKQCKKCKSVFLKNDSYFNMICVVAEKKKQDLRERLESK